MSESETLRGIVKWFNDAKGFGFIEHTTGKDVFVHYSVIEDEGFKTLKDGEEVSYEIKEGPKGLHAVKVTRANQPDEEAGEQGVIMESDSDGDTDDDSDESDEAFEVGADSSNTAKTEEDLQRQ